MTSNELTALVLDCEEYKEKDGLVTLLCEDGIRTVYARGIGKITSKNRMVCQPFSKVKVFLDEKNNRMSLLLHGHVEEFYYRIQENLTYMTTCFLLRDYLKRTTITSTMYTGLEMIWKAFQTGEANVYTKACFLMREILQQEGIGIHVDGCINCGRKNHIETLSIRDGGFLCTECNGNRYPKRSKKELIQYYSLMRVKEEQLNSFYNTYSLGLDDLIYLANWFENYSAYTSTSLRLLKSIGAME